MDKILRMADIYHNSNNNMSCVALGLLQENFISKDSVIRFSREFESNKTMFIKKLGHKIECIKLHFFNKNDEIEEIELHCKNENEHKIIKIRDGELINLDIDYISPLNTIYYIENFSGSITVTFLYECSKVTF